MRTLSSATVVCLEPVQLLPPAPWGSPPTPLLPRWHLETLSTVSLPAELLARPSYSASAVPGRVLGDLARIWELRSEPVAVGVLRALYQLVSRYPVPPWDHVVIPSGAHLSRLLECPFRIRAMNCIRKAVKTGRLRSDRAVTVGQLLSLENLGQSTLLEVMCVAEAATDSGFLTGLQRAESTAQHPLSPPPTDLPASSMDSWGDATELFKKLLAVSGEFHGARTLADALMSDLGKLISALEMADSFDRVLLADLVPGPTMAESVLQGLRELWKTLSSVERLTFEHRVAAPKPLPLEQVGRKANLTRERIRQIQKSIESSMRPPDGTFADVGWWLSAIATVVQHHAGPVIAESDLQERIAATFPNKEDPGADRAMAPMARRLLRKRLGYRSSDGICLDEAASKVVEGLKAAGRSIADDVGLIDEHQLQGWLPDEDWRVHWDVLLGQCGFRRLSDRLALRDTKKARVKVALLVIGRPATREELGALCGTDPARVGSLLSGIASVVRADKKRWGLAEWVEDEYEGIPAEIVQRIEEDGGATRLDRLVEELPRLFGVTESSVRSYVATSKFLLRDGYVSVADESTISLRPLADAVHGYTLDGRPYWRFKVEARYFDGYSLAGVPPEIVSALGCGPDDRISVPVSDPAGCGPVSVGWRLASTTGTDVGYLSEPLRRLGAGPGEHVLLVIGGRGSISFGFDVLARENWADRGAGNVGSGDRGRDILERIKNRRRGL